MPGCNKEAMFDDKTIYGPWANLCEADQKRFGVGIGFRFEKRVKIAAKKTNCVPVVTIPLSEDALFDGVAEVQCPHCGESRTVEPDANYVVICENCGNRYKVESQI